MQAILGLVVILFYLFLCHIVGSKASDKGGSYLLWFIIAIIFSPLVGFVLMLMFS